ncbi:[NiFe]-hydrogenase assembly chaperone HybE [Xanthobacter tagetidis]|uniref:[NiFe]-hydrogenase assembly, chaperone, HybE n=1 Tax=Xanthobacter tagetidis TaxID=60216 RepID=A0A3L7AGZ7_9HYPH|nr:[NiFe]-hydrogenase assembly chaperone HybE [Xanthobacter tagetidis]MBB6306737.1 [NiFe] hydrogenase assembly HybE family chaperone [Xanthobacter tagetidis]RLP78958.1 [NiFe]-hydrogenase assembly, chaperone, HybE [Xanthobacter tagetidis]
MNLHRGFEGSYMGDNARLAPTARLECKICWHVYDPTQGCDTWDVPPGTPFAALPDHWRCPVCDGERTQFMVLDPGLPQEAAPTPAAAAPQVDPRLAALVAAAPGRFEAAFREIHAGKMKGVPFVNETLSVKALGFRIHDGRGLGVLVTPWFMNLILLPGPDEDWSGAKTGEKSLMDFASGTYEFLAADRPETGPYRACSLFSPMFDFTSMLQAVETAAAVIPALLDPANREDGTRAGEIRRRAERAEAETDDAPPPDAGAVPADLSRRAIIFGPRADAPEADAS